MPIKNPRISSHSFLADMYGDGYFPKPQVDKVKGILVTLCESIEGQKPQSAEEFLELTHRATEKINDLAAEFEENDSELETVARECMGADFGVIADAYGFGEIDVEALIAPRDW